MKISILKSTITALLAPGKGLLAADESLPTIGKRFGQLGIPSTAEHRRAYRDMLFTAPGLAEFISGVILFDETIRENIDGTLAPEALVRRGMIPGIKVDLGMQPLPGFPGETITQGLGGLRERLGEYRALGARFTKWRAAFAMEGKLPTRTCLKVNSESLAQFAVMSQEADLVPIVEPEVLMNGAHSLACCGDITAVALESVFTELKAHGVALECMILKTGMVLPGADCPQPADAAEIAEATRRCLLHVVPTTVPGIVFLSGGQGDVEASERLNAICASGDLPWRVTFSFGRALQAPALEIWGSREESIVSAQEALVHRARCNHLALSGQYLEETESVH